MPTDPDLLKASEDAERLVTLITGVRYGRRCAANVSHVRAALLRARADGIEWAAKKAESYREADRIREEAARLRALADQEES